MASYICRYKIRARAGWGRGFTVRSKECGRPQREIAKGGVTDLMLECDEYPFNASMQGGPRSDRVSLRLIPMTENRAVGGHLRALIILSRMKRGSKFLVVSAPEIPVTVALPDRDKR